MSAPTISVVVAAYNCEAYVAETIAAILAQTRPPDEVVVVDDGSTDGTPTVLASFGDAIRVVRQANSGAAGAYNRAFGEVSGDYVARCDADDVWTPTKLERQLAAMETHPEVDVAVGGAWVFGRAVERLFSPAPANGLTEPESFRRLVYEGNPICSSTALIRRSLLQTLPPLSPRLPCEDYELWLNVLAAGGVFYWDPEVLVRYRQHEGNVTNNLIEMHRAANLMHRRFAHLAGDDRLARRVCARGLATIGRLLVDQDRPHEARAAFRRSLRERPTAFALAWSLLLTAPGQLRRALVRASLSIHRGLSGRAHAAR